MAFAELMTCLEQATRLFKPDGPYEATIVCNLTGVKMTQFDERFQRIALSVFLDRFPGVPASGVFYNVPPFIRWFLKVITSIAPKWMRQVRACISLHASACISMHLRAFCYIASSRLLSPPLTTSRFPLTSSHLLSLPASRLGCSQRFHFFKGGAASISPFVRIEDLPNQFFGGQNTALTCEKYVAERATNPPLPSPPLIPLPWYALPFSPPLVPRGRYIAERAAKEGVTIGADMKPVKQDLDPAIAAQLQSLYCGAKDLPDVIKAGWMSKQGGAIKNWKKRYLVLRAGILYYFKVATTPQSPIISYHLRPSPANLSCFHGHLSPSHACVLPRPSLTFSRMCVCVCVCVCASSTITRTRKPSSRRASSSSRTPPPSRAPKQTRRARRTGCSSPRRCAPMSSSLDRPPSAMSGVTQSTSNATSTMAECCQYAG